MKSLQELCQRRSERVQPKGFCNTFTRVTKGPQRISLPPRAQDAMARSHHTHASGPVSREALLSTLPHQKRGHGDPVGSMTKQSFASDKYKKSLKMHKQNFQGWWRQAANSATFSVYLVTLLVTLEIPSVRI